MWSIVTDTTDPNLANLHGVDYSPKLAYAVTGKAAREARIDKDGVIVFKSGKVDFSPERSITPGEAPNFFPPTAAQPGSVGDADYSPLVQFANGKDALFNMPMVAFNVSEDDLNKMCVGNVVYSKVEDKVVKICPREGAVTLKLTLGYTFGKPIFYLSTEANDPVVATLEGATYTPALKDVPFALEDASPGEAAERIYTFVNGPTGIDNPFRQGLDSALSDKGTHGPLNVLGGIPTINLDYSPLFRRRTSCLRGHGRPGIRPPSSPRWWSSAGSIRTTCWTIPRSRTRIRRNFAPGRSASRTGFSAPIISRSAMASTMTASTSVSCRRAPAVSCFCCSIWRWMTATTGPW